MKRVVVFQGLGTLVPDQALPAGVWQRGQTTPAESTAIWYGTKSIVNKDRFPRTNPTPAINCRPCASFDSDPSCCPQSEVMPQYTDWGAHAYQSAAKPWNQDSQSFVAPPSTNDIIQHAMKQSLRQAQLENASFPESGPPDPAYQLSGFIGSGGQGQVHLLGNGQGQKHLLGNPWAPYGLNGGCGCNSLGGIFTDDAGKLNTTGMVTIGVGSVAILGFGYWLLTKKRSRRR